MNCIAIFHDYLNNFVSIADLISILHIIVHIKTHFGGHFEIFSMRLFEFEIYKQHHRMSSDLIASFKVHFY